MVGRRPYLAILVILLLLGIPFVLNYVRITGFITYNPYASGSEPLSNMEPSAAQQSYQNYNTIESDPLSGKYTFKYLGPDIKITYTIDPDDTSSTKTALFRAITANVDYQGTSFNFQPSKGGVKLSVDGQTVDPWSTSTAVTRKTISESFSQNGLFVSYNLSFNGKSTIVNLTYSIKGKTLVMDMKASNGIIERIGPEYTSGASPTEFINPKMPYASEWKNSIRKGNVFVTVFSDEEYSRATRITGNTPTALSEGRSYWNYFVYYDLNTQNARQTAEEKFYMTISDDWMEVFPGISHPVSPYRDYLKNKIVFDIWHWPYACTEFTDYLTLMHNYGFKDLLVNTLGPCNQWETKLIPNITAYGYDYIRFSTYFDCYFSDNSECKQAEFIAQNQDGSMIKSWYDAIRNEQTYAVRANRQKEIMAPIETYKKSKGVD